MNANPPPPPPTIRPWTRGEVPINSFFMLKDDPDHNQFVLTLERENGLLMGIQSCHWSTQSLPEMFTHMLTYFIHSTDGGKTWKPCGVEE